MTDEPRKAEQDDQQDEPDVEAHARRRGSEEEEPEVEAHMLRGSGSPDEMRGRRTGAAPEDPEARLRKT